MRGYTGLLRRKTSLSGFILRLLYPPEKPNIKFDNENNYASINNKCFEDSEPSGSDTSLCGSMQRKVKILRIEMKYSKNLQRNKHGLKTSTKFYSLEERERENILQDHTLITLCLPSSRRLLYIDNSSYYNTEYK